jgi:molybdenum cofactor synthesis domain-containing protein
MDKPSKDSSAITAALILIGNELLSGRTQDANLGHLAQRLSEVGISLVEARVIPDVDETIIATVNELRERVSYVFTTGGIGPTHDDITAECIAKAFNVPLIRHPEAERRLIDYFETRGVEVNEARLRMANTPEGAELIANQISVAPGFSIGNVYVMAGVPKVMRMMVEEILPRLEHRAPITSATVVCDLAEGTVAMGLREIQSKYADLSIGSYPGRASTGYRVSLVVRGSDSDQVTAAAGDIASLVHDLGGHIEQS